MIYIKLVPNTLNNQIPNTYILFMYNSDIQTVIQYIYQYMDNV